MFRSQVVNNQVHIYYKNQLCYVVSENADIEKTFERLKERKYLQKCLKSYRVPLSVFLKEWVLFWMWLLRKTKYNKVNKVWVAQGYPRLAARIFKKYGQRVILCSSDVSFEYFHELGHCVMGHADDLVCNRQLDYELSADDFAADILGAEQSLSYMESMLKEAEEHDLDTIEWKIRMNRMKGGI
jgi:hypothetical protein